MQNARFFRSLLRAGIAASAALAIIATAAPATAAGVAPGAATPVQREQAQSRFLRGKELYTQGKFDAALAEFTASLDIVASPNTRLYVGRCLREMGKTVSAYVELGRAAVEAKELARDDPRYEKAGSAATEERRQLEPKLGFVEISIKNAAPSTTLKVAGDEVRRGGWAEPVPALPGSTEVVVETPGHAPITRTVSVTAGKKEALEIDADAGGESGGVASGPPTETPAEPAKPSSGGGSNLRPYAYVAGGIAVAGLATFTVFGLLSNGTYSDLEQECGSKPCPAGHEDEISRGRTQQTIANVGFAFFLIGGAAAVTLFVLGKPSGSASTGATSARVVARGSYLGLEGSF